MTAYFITVERCNSGRRGVFCSRDGGAFPSDTPHTKDEMWEVLGAFDLILAPKSEPFTEEQLKEYTPFQPLAEYSMQYGIALKLEEVQLEDTNA